MGTELLFRIVEKTFTSWRDCLPVKISVESNLLSFIIYPKDPHYYYSSIHTHASEVILPFIMYYNTVRILREDKRKYKCSFYSDIYVYSYICVYGSDRTCQCGNEGEDIQQLFQHLLLLSYYHLHTESLYRNAILN
jgi:hypothetical protein